MTKPPGERRVYTHIAHLARVACPGGMAMYVSLNAVQQAVRLVDCLAELDDPAGFAELALPGLALLVGCDHLSYNEIGPAPVQLSSACYPPGAVPPVSLAVFAAHVHEHPLVNHYRVTGDRQPVKISDFLSRQRFHRLGLYAEFFRHFPVEYQIAISLPGPAAQVIGIALNRARSDFTEADRDLLGLLRDPLMTALRRARVRQRARHALAEASSAGSPTSPTARSKSSSLSPWAAPTAPLPAHSTSAPARSPNTSNASTVNSTSPAAPPPPTTAPLDQAGDAQHQPAEDVRSHAEGMETEIFKRTRDVADNRRLKEANTELAVLYDRSMELAVPYRSWERELTSSRPNSSPT